MPNDLGWMYNQSGVIPIRYRDGILEILLITSRRKKHWVIPKGIIEGDLSPQDSAAQEAYEEAGIKGTIKPVSLGKYRYKKWGGTCKVEVFLMRVSDELEVWPEDYFRERKWLDLDSAVALVDEPGLKKLLTGISKLKTKKSTIS